MTLKEIKIKAALMLSLSPKKIISLGRIPMDLKRTMSDDPTDRHDSSIWGITKSGNFEELHLEYEYTHRVHGGFATDEGEMIGEYLERIKPKHYAYFFRIMTYPDEWWGEVYYGLKKND